MHGRFADHQALRGEGILKQADPQAIAAAQGRLHEGAIADAFAMGQLSFAQQLASQAVDVGIDQAFLDALKAKKFERYARTQCGRTVEGNSPAFKKIAEEQNV